MDGEYAGRNYIMLGTILFTIEYAIWLTILLPGFLIRFLLCLLLFFVLCRLCNNVYEIKFIGLMCFKEAFHVL